MFIIFYGNYRHMKKILRSKKRKQKNSVCFVFVLSSLAACNNDSKKILGLAGNAASEGIEKLFQVSPVVNSNYSISTTNPNSSIGDGTNSLPIEVSGAVIASPNISGYPLLDLKFTAPGTIDFTNISDVENLSISNSTAAVTLSNLPNDIEKIFINDTQSGDWNISYFPNSFAVMFLEWTNNTGTPIDLTSLSINEVGQFLLKTSGNENITIPTLNLDPDDTQRIEIGNDNDGNIIIGEAANITGTQGLKTISLKTFNDGDITLGMPSNSSLPDLQNISSITLIASQNGNITIGDLGTNTSINKISNISLTTEGGSLSLGSIKAKQIENFTVFGKEFSTISIGNIEIEENIPNFTLSGDANISLGEFSGNGTIKLDASNMTKNGLNLDFTDLKGNVDLLTTSQDDTILLGDNAGKVLSGAGNDIVTLPTNVTGSADIRSGDGVDIITLATNNFIDIINTGGTNISSIDKSAQTHSEIIADKIINFDPDSDKIGIGSITATSNNFLAETGATNFGDALSKSDIAMTSGNQYYFSYNVASATEGFSLLFYDNDNNGSSDIVLTLTGITTNVISHDHLIIV